MRLRLLVLLVGVCACAGPTAESTDLQGTIKARVDQGKNTGIVVGVIRSDGTSEVAAYGAAGPGALPLDRDTVFEIGSITKVFTTTLLADMVARNEVALDDPVAKYLPESVRVPERKPRRITLVDLATHTSGMPRLMTNLSPADRQNPYADYTVDQLYAFISKLELSRDIGAEFEYSNAGMGLLGHALARSAGKDYETLIKERVLAPLGMNHTGITLTPAMRKHLVRGHGAAHQPVPAWDVAAIPGAGALRSSMSDMLRFARANMDPPATPLQRAMQETHADRHAAGRPNMKVGLGWLIRILDDGRKVLWHNGGTGGFRTWMGFDKDRRVAVIVLTNSVHGADDLGLQLVTDLGR
jgi:D-alanyl-D-alanine-carboxypeptidase/D-alanyl-D-alanine-endopeptidase